MPRLFFGENMSVALYSETHLAGAYARLGPGRYVAEDISFCSAGGAGCITGGTGGLDAQSVRVDPNTIIVLSAGHADTARGTRVLVGPVEIPDLSTLGLTRVARITVKAFRAYDGAAPPSYGATICDNYAMAGRRASLWRGDHSATRLSGSEAGFDASRIVSLSLAADTVVILYTGPLFETDRDAAAVFGPAELEDVDTLGLGGRIGSIRVLLDDPFSVGAAVAATRAKRETSGGLPPADWVEYRPGQGLGMVVPPGAPFLGQTYNSGRVRKVTPGFIHAEIPIPRGGGRGGMDHFAAIAVIFFILLVGMAVFAIGRAEGAKTSGRIDIYELMQN